MQAQAGRTLHYFHIQGSVSDRVRFHLALAPACRRHCAVPKCMTTDPCRHGAGPACSSTAVKAGSPPRSKPHWRRPICFAMAGPCLLQQISPSNPCPAAAHNHPHTHTDARCCWSSDSRTTGPRRNKGRSNTTSRHTPPPQTFNTRPFRQNISKMLARRPTVAVKAQAKQQVRVPW